MRITYFARHHLATAAGSGTLPPRWAVNAALVRRAVFGGADFGVAFVQMCNAMCSCQNTREHTKKSGGWVQIFVAVESE